VSDFPRFELDRFKAVVIASGTGGASQVEQMLAGLPAALSVPILIAQQMAPSFAETFATRLDLISPLTVVDAQDTMRVFAGTVYLGHCDQHIRVYRWGSQPVTIEISQNPEDLVPKPSADQLFQSCAKVYGCDTLAVVMSGLGSDGTAGAREVKQAGGVVLTQTPETCAFDSMPRSCVEAGLSDDQLGPDEIRQAIFQLSPKNNRFSNSVYPFLT